MGRSVVVIGLGSMGKRRIRLMKQIDEDILIYGVDSQKSRCAEAEKLYGIKTFTKLDDALKQEVNCVFICTSPLSHGKLITACLKNGLNVFTEINLVADEYQTNIQMAKEKGLVLFLSSTFLYRDEINYIQKCVKDSNSLLTYTYHVGQYLPDWHPWESYTDYFIGDKRTNGCRELMAIEFPWIYKTFGPIKNVSVLKGKKTKLNISYADSYVLHVEHEGGIQGQVAVDVVSRKAVRNLEVFGEDLYLSWDGTATGLRNYNLETKSEEEVSLYSNVDQQEGYASFIIENAYKNEILAFFNEVETGEISKYSFEDDIKILKWIDKIEG